MCLVCGAKYCTWTFVTPVASLRQALEEPQEDTPVEVEEYLTSLQSVMEQTKKLAEEQEEKAKARAKADYDRRNRVVEAPLQVGDLVMSLDPDITKGLLPKWRGP